MPCLFPEFFSVLCQSSQYTPNYFKIFSPHVPLPGVDFSPGIAFTSSGELNHSDMVPPCRGDFEIKDLSIPTDPEVAQKT